LVGRTLAAAAIGVMGTTRAAASPVSTGIVSAKADPVPRPRRARLEPGLGVSCEVESGVGRMLAGVRLASGDGLLMADRSPTCGLCGGVDEREWTPNRDARLP
jgi:uncharacterized protein YbbK (DUF523 family)